MPEPTLFLDGKVTLYQGDSLDVLKGFPDGTFDGIVTDPPYGISFMGRSDWDGAGPEQRAFSKRFWREALRVLKPGGHLLAFGAARTYHRLAVAIEDAGFEIRDALWQLVEAEAGVQTFMASLDASQAEALRKLCEDAGFGGILGWVFGTGFPKGGDLAKAIDKHLGVKGTLGAPKSAAHAEWIARGAMRGEGGHAGYQRPWMDDPEAVEANARQYVGGCEESQEWAGFAPALKPALEPIALARKPFTGSLAANVLKHGCGALNIDACRVPFESEADREAAMPVSLGTAHEGFGGKAFERKDRSHIDPADAQSPLGRFPTHLILDGSAEVAAGFPVNAGSYRPNCAGKEYGQGREIHGNSGGVAAYNGGYSDAGSASRYFYSSKADDVDRIGLEHPTIKPLDLMQWCTRLVVRPGGLVLDPFAGTGTTGEAAYRLGMRAVLIERDPVHCTMIGKRMAYAVSALDARRTQARRAKAERRAAAGGAPKPTDALDLFV